VAHTRRYHARYLSVGHVWPGRFRSPVVQDGDHLRAVVLGMDQTHVTFRWKDPDADAWRTERLPGVELLRRFLQHVLPRGFHKVRYYGLAQREQFRIQIAGPFPSAALTAPAFAIGTPPHAPSRGETLRPIGFSHRRRDEKSLV
jgi:putative transposase